MDFEIKLLYGLGNLNFNMSPEKVAEMAGAPTETEEIDNMLDGSVETLAWHYSEEDTILFFDVTCGEPKLKMIESSHPELKLSGRMVFELSRDELAGLMKVGGFSEVEEDDEIWGEHRISFDDAQADFYYIGDKLNLVSWSNY